MCLYLYVHSTSVYSICLSPSTKFVHIQNLSNHSMSLSHCASTHSIYHNIYPQYLSTYSTLLDCTLNLPILHLLMST